MALHPNFPESPYAILDPAIRWFPADESLRETSMDKLMPPLVPQLRKKVKEWRDSGYVGATDTSRSLLNTTALCGVIAMFESRLFGSEVSGLVVLDGFGGEFNRRERATAVEPSAADDVQRPGHLFEGDLRVFPPAVGRSARRRRS